MNALRRNHLVIAGFLFVDAAILYALGLQFEAGLFIALGAVVEVGAWIALLTDRSEGSFPGVKQ